MRRRIGTSVFFFLLLSKASESPKQARKEEEEEGRGVAEIKSGNYEQEKEEEASQGFSLTRAVHCVLLKSPNQ